MWYGDLYPQTLSAIKVLNWLNEIEVLSFIQWIIHYNTHTRTMQTYILLETSQATAIAARYNRTNSNFLFESDQIYREERIKDSSVREGGNRIEYNVLVMNHLVAEKSPRSPSLLCVLFDQWLFSAKIVKLVLKLLL